MLAAGAVVWFPLAGPAFCRLVTELCSFRRRRFLFMADDPNALRIDELKARVGSLRRYL